MVQLLILIKMISKNYLKKLYSFLFDLGQKKIPLKDLIIKWSGRQDLNLQPLGPKPNALPS